MHAEFEFWRLLAGLGLFLFGMFQLETALESLAGRSFKRFLKSHTTPPIKGVVTGTLATAALQSSSVVSLIVLAFVGTGILSLAGALGIVFGANLGTTATGWIVATIGFKLDIEALSLPFIAAGAAGVVWTARDSRLAGLSCFALGLGLMLMGLEYMKSGAAQASMIFDPVALREYPPIVFLLAGLALTAVVQSSSATIMITLSALYADLIPLTSAAAAAIGADLGTTITAILGATAGSESKKRVAAAIVTFNLVTDAIAFILLDPLIAFITQVLSITDPLYTLVAFHSLFNLIGIALFLPVIKPFSERLEHHFRSGRGDRIRYLRSQDRDTPELAVANIARETRRLLDQVAAVNQLSFQLTPTHHIYDFGDDRRDVAVFAPGARFDAAYAAVKELEGEILAFSLSVQELQLEPPEAERLAQLIPAIRNAVHSAKCIRDTHHDLKLFRDSENDDFHAFLGKFRDNVANFYGELKNLEAAADIATLKFEALMLLKQRNESLHSAIHADVYQQVRNGALSRAEISTLLNVNREIYTANQSLLHAIAELSLDTAAADTYLSLPVEA